MSKAKKQPSSVLKSAGVQVTFPGGFGRAAEKFAETIRHVVDLSFPGRVRKKIIAEAEGKSAAMVIQAEGRAKVREIEARAITRVRKLEIRRQENIESIVRKAVDELPPPEQMSEQPVNEDWTSRFFQECQDIGNEEMQQIWARILAGEVARPDSFAPRTLRIVRDLTTSDANLFASLCNFTWETSGSGILISKGVVATLLNLDAPYILKAELNFDALAHLSTIGLIEFRPEGGLYLKELGHEFSLSYCGKSHKLKPKDAKVVLRIGHVLLTMAGKELAGISIRQRNDQFEKDTLDEWKRTGWNEI